MSPVAGFSVSNTTEVFKRFVLMVVVVPVLLMAAAILLPDVVAIVGFGYVPAKSPAAAPPGATPEMAKLPALVILPCASTVKLGTCVAVPYVPAVTAVLARLIVPVLLIGPPDKPVPVAMFVTVPKAGVVQVGTPAFVASI